jgi:RNA 2',3'-cyclic 3'-phosphodiesterase
MRVFIALDIDEDIRQRIIRFMDGLRGFAPEARWVRPESLHVTLKFIGEKPVSEVEKIKNALASMHSDAFELSFRSYGFFPTVKAARVFWVGIESDQLAALAKAVDAATAALGIPKEEHAFTPHLTLARGGRGSGNPRREKSDRSNNIFHVVQERLSVLSAPEFGTMAAREFFLYESQLSRSGSRYTKIGEFALKKAPAHS